MMEDSMNFNDENVALSIPKNAINNNGMLCFDNNKVFKNIFTPSELSLHSPVKDFAILLDTIEDLAKKYRGTYKLQLRGAYKKKIKTMPYSRCANSKYLETILLEWEELLNKKSMDEPIIRVENLVDDCPPPSDFEYILENIANCDIREMCSAEYSVGCSCKRCTPKGCTCASTDGNRFAYDRSQRILIEPGLPVFECRSSCSCSSSCANRVVQRGRTIKVMIFRTCDGRGWGVKTLDVIRKNQFVMEYVGEIITNEEAEQRGKVYDAAQQTYLFDLDLASTEASYAIDAYHYGNVSHFINHSVRLSLICIFEYFTVRIILLKELAKTTAK